LRGLQPPPLNKVFPFGAKPIFTKIFGTKIFLWAQLKDTNSNIENISNGILQ